MSINHSVDERADTNLNNSGYNKITATAAAFSGLFTYAIALSVFPASINSVGASFGVGGKEFAAMFFLFFAGFIAAIPIGTAAARRLGKQLAVGIGCVIMAFSCLAFGIAPSFAAVITAYCILGFGGGIAEPISSALISEAYSGRQRTAMLNYSQVAFGVGAVGAPFAVGWVLANGVDWRVVFFISSALCFCAFFISCIRCRVIRSYAVEKKTRSVAAFRSPLLLVLSSGMFFYVGSELGTANWLAKYFTDLLKSDPVLAANTISFFWGGVTLGRFIAGALSRRMSDITLIRISLASALVWQVVLVLQHSPVLASVAVWFVGLSLAAIWPTILAYAGGHYEGDVESAFGILIAAGCIGAVTLPPAIGAISDVVGWRWALSICPVLGLLNLILFSVINRVELPSGSASQ